MNQWKNTFLNKKCLYHTLKEEVNTNIIIVGDFNTHLTSMERTSRQKINKERLALKDTFYQMDLIVFHRTFHLKAAEYTFFFSSAHIIFSRIQHIPGYKTSLNKCKKIKIISSIFFNYSGMRLEINYKKKTGKNTNTGS